MIAVLFGAHPEVARSQGIFENAKNIQVLPEDITPGQLRDIMRGFTKALGVRCTYCHVGEEGAPLTTYDFESDDKANKDRARAMYKMLGMINERLSEIEPSGKERVNMWCHTCHKGKPRPQTLLEAVMEAREEGGGDAAVERFIELRGRYFGSAAFDFTAGNVNQVGSQLFRVGDAEAALRLFEMNVEHYPDFAEGWESLGDYWAAQGEKEKAIGLYEHALELAPNHPRIRKSLQAIR